MVRLSDKMEVKNKEIELALSTYSYILLSAEVLSIFRMSRTQWKREAPY